jgi:superfamily II DNA/RNA helicase
MVADMGFLPVVRRLIDLTSLSRQILLFSATLDGPVDKLVRAYQHDPVRYEVEPAGVIGEVHHHFWRVEPRDRVTITVETVLARGPALVFCRTKRGADRLSDHLTRSGLKSAAIHGNRNQSQRERALTAFRAGRLDVLVATDIAARGIHVDAVPLVIHFDPPSDPTDYVHRSGRTGRAGADGIVVSLVGNGQVAGARSIQQRLGLTSGVCSPDVPSLALVDDGLRSPSIRGRVSHASDAAGTIKRRKLAALDPARASKHTSGRRTRKGRPATLDRANRAQPSPDSRREGAPRRQHSAQSTRQDEQMTTSGAA